MKPYFEIIITYFSLMRIECHAQFCFYILANLEYYILKKNLM